VDLTHQDVRKGDVLVICSDGLSGQVKKDEIAAVTSESTDLVKVCDRLITLANDRGGPDNITVIVARFDGDALRHSQADEAVGHQVYPLIDTETSTEPVPVYRGSPPPVPSRQSRSQGRILTGALVLVAAAALALALLRHS
jgi:protein phosphatase